MRHDNALQVDFSAGPTRQIVELLLEHAVWLILIVLLAGFCIFIPGYAQTGIFFNILEQSTFIGLLSVSLAIVIIAGQMDLSCEATMALSAMVTAWLGSSQGLNLDLPGWLIVPITLSAALLLGIVIALFNALLVLRVGVTAFIATLATYIFFRGTVVAFNGGKGIFGLNSDLRAIATFRVLGAPGLAVITIFIFVIFSAILRKTPFGRYLYLLGGNAVAPFRAGIPVVKVAVWAFVISGLLSAFAGWLLAARTAGATANLGVGMIFEAFAAVVIGGVSLKGGVGSLPGVFAGVLLLTSIRTAINLLGMPPQYTQMIQGALVLAAMTLDSFKQIIRVRYL